MIVYNTLTRAKEEFRPLTEGQVRFYTCGPTVYNFAHIGNFRAYVFEDILRRVLRYAGYRVTQVMNLTDVDDKTIRMAAEEGIPLKQFTQKYIDAFFSDAKSLNIEAAEFYPAATDHVGEMIAIIQKLLDKGLAYRAEDGSVYFKVAAFANYGRLARIDRSELVAGARVAQDEYAKEHVGDFALWKGWDEKDGAVAWDAPWGRGRPGWHIECSAMSTKYLGNTFDIHTGGIDNLFPHHENEIAQTEGATGEPFVRYWMHCAHLQVNGTKMSKSLGNFFTLRDLLAKGWHGREIRYVLLSGHYRQPLNFTFSALEAARAALARVDSFTGRLADLAATAGAGTLSVWAEDGKSAFDTAVFDDLNTPEALAALFGVIHKGNAAMQAGELVAGEAAALLALMSEFDRVLGVIYFGREASFSAIPAEIQRLADARAAARRNREWAESDRLRHALNAAGWDVRDGKDGQKLTPRAQP